MSCCTPTIFPFYNVATSTIDYSPLLREKYGRVPQVQVSYYDEEADEYYVSNNSTRVSLSGNPVNSIAVDHGGAASGIVRII
jgi:hypothetical protein